MRRSLRLSLVALCLLVATWALVGCGTERKTAQGTASFTSYSADGTTFTVNLAGVHPDTRCINQVAYQWSEPATFYEAGQFVTAWSNVDCIAALTTSLVVPTHAGGGTLWIRLAETTSDEISGTTYLAWMSVDVPAFVAPAAPVASLFAHAAPTGEEGTLLDARLSVGRGSLSYAWSPSDCAGTTYLNGGRFVNAPVGTASISGRYEGPCTVTVTDGATGKTATATLQVTRNLLLGSGSFAFVDSPAAAVITGSHEGGANATHACVDLTNSGLFASKVVLSGLTDAVPLTVTEPGTHRISATLWAGDVNPDCAVPVPAGAVPMQTISDLYTVDALGRIATARRHERSQTFVAPSSLRFTSTKTISEGTVDRATLAVKDATMSGTFTWSTPASAKGVKRPAGAAQLGKGTFVMRSIDMVQGPSVGKASTLLGTGTVLLRGTDGTLACGTLAGGFDSSALSLSGGTRSARTLAGNVTGKQVTYVFPTAASARSGGISGMLATALDWLTGDQPADRAAKPAKKPKLVKVKPVKATGTASLQTAAKPAGLPASCKALVQYLPQ
ncbi:MAG: hypothetical protein WCN97_09070 [Thermoleophilia bacterium]